MTSVPCLFNLEDGISLATLAALRKGKDSCNKIKNLKLNIAFHETVSIHCGDNIYVSRCLQNVVFYTD